MNLNDEMTPKQKELAEKHGNPAQFAQACYKAVPAFISMTEAREAIDKYNHEWREASQCP